MTRRNFTMNASVRGWADILGIWLVACLWFADGAVCTTLVLYLTGQLR
jgi:hypothetical protein